MVRLAIEHRPAESRFATRVEGHLCVADYLLAGDVMQITHTFVPPELRGHGVAAALVEAALAHAAARGLRVDPLCAYVRSYMRRHPETRLLLAPGLEP